MRIAPEAVMAYRASIGAGDVLVLADIQVKYAQMLVPRSLSESAGRALRAGADAVVVTGTRTGEPPSAREVQATGWSGDQWLIEHGLAAGDRVIVDGVQKVGPGRVVKPVPLTDSLATGASLTSAPTAGAKP